MNNYIITTKILREALVSTPLNSKALTGSQWKRWEVMPRWEDKDVCHAQIINRKIQLALWLWKQQQTQVKSNISKENVGEERVEAI